MWIGFAPWESYKLPILILCQRGVLVTENFTIMDEETEPEYLLDLWVCLEIFFQMPLGAGSKHCDSCPLNIFISPVFHTFCSVTFSL